jgi:hypothetical protein
LVDLMGNGGEQFTPAERCVGRLHPPYEVLVSGATLRCGHGRSGSVSTRAKPDDLRCRARLAYAA